MRVIRNGREKPKPVEVTCRTCNSVLEVTSQDAKRSGSDRDGAFYVFDCPVCNAGFYVAQSVVDAV